MKLEVLKRDYEWNVYRPYKSIISGQDIVIECASFRYLFQAVDFVIRELEEGFCIDSEEVFTIIEIKL
jgi:hypothetical protein